MGRQSGGNAVAEKRVDFAYNALGQFTEIARYKDTSGGGANELTSSMNKIAGVTPSSSPKLSMATAPGPLANALIVPTSPGIWPFTYYTYKIMGWTGAAVLKVPPLIAVSPAAYPSTQQVYQAMGWTGAWNTN